MFNVFAGCQSDIVSDRNPVVDMKSASRQRARDREGTMRRSHPNNIAGANTMVASVEIFRLNWSPKAETIYGLAIAAVTSKTSLSGLTRLDGVERFPVGKTLRIVARSDHAAAQAVAGASMITGCICVAGNEQEINEIYSRKREAAGGNGLHDVSRANRFPSNYFHGWTPQEQCF